MEKSIKRKKNMGTNFPRNAKVQQLFVQLRRCIRIGRISAPRRCLEAGGPHWRKFRGCISTKKMYYSLYRIEYIN